MIENGMHVTLYVDPFSDRQISDINRRQRASSMACLGPSLYKRADMLCYED